jgi:hypothetical protein
MGGLPGSRVAEAARRLAEMSDAGRYHLPSIVVRIRASRAEQREAGADRGVDTLPCAGRAGSSLESSS